MTAIIYTHAPDFVMAVCAARCLQALGVRPILAVDRRDSLLRAEGIEVVRTGFNRHGNLNGREFIAGNLRLMAEVSSGDYTLKVDSDALVMSLGWLEGRTETAVGIYVPKMQGMQGCCYALRSSDLPAMIEMADNLDPKLWLIEDRTTGHLAEAVGRVHLPIHGRDDTGFVTWRPDRGRSLAWYRRHNVVVFPRLPGHGREEIAEAMFPFLPLP